MSNYERFQKGQESDLSKQYFQYEQLKWWLKNPEIKSFVLAISFSKYKVVKETYSFELTTDTVPADFVRTNTVEDDLLLHPNFGVSRDYPCNIDTNKYYHNRPSSKKRVYRPDFTNEQMQKLVDVAPTFNVNISGLDRRNQVLHKALFIQQTRWWLKHPTVKSFYLGKGADFCSGAFKLENALHCSLWHLERESHLTIRNYAYHLTTDDSQLPKELEGKNLDSKDYDFYMHSDFYTEIYPIDMTQRITEGRIYRPALTDSQLDSALLFAQVEKENRSVEEILRMVKND